MELISSFLYLYIVRQNKSRTNGIIGKFGDNPPARKVGEQD